MTITTRGQTPADAVTRIKADRTNRETMIGAFSNCHYDIATIKSALILKTPKSPWKRLATALSDIF
ncbi:hypothetical protein GC102_20410 [Paenibacillus sp. LMG 31460]|uniref:Uncharacterized protein n=2 Tax=Paenibacillus germinis TaxID=2654979 RepID=A0ABX1Z4D8_9BACL|nr:hypothetical protein [Paenibacillus germinis]NOU88113.1 hypothetical protein [Paenibacillus germinis]